MNDLNKKKTKVLQFSLGATMGGIVSYMLSVWKFIDKNKFQFDFVTFAKHLEIEKELKAQGCKIHHFSCYPEQNEELFIKELKDILNCNNYDIFEIHTTIWRSTVVERVAKEIGVPKVIVHSHSVNVGVSAKFPTQESAEQAKVIHESIKAEITSDLATDFWACSKASASWLFPEKLITEKVKIIPNTIDTEKFKYSSEIRKQMRNELALGDGYVLGYAGRLDAVKNVVFLADVLREMVQSKPNTYLLILGDGPEREKVTKRLNEFGLENHVCLPGRVGNVNDYLQAMDAFLLPSEYEAFPICLLEAHCAGLKCFVSDRVTKEIDITGETEYLPLRNAKLWSDSIIAYWNKRGDRCSNAALLKGKGFDTKTMIDNLEKLYMQ